MGSNERCSPTSDELRRRRSCPLCYRVPQLPCQEKGDLVLFECRELCGTFQIEPGLEDALKGMFDLVGLLDRSYLACCTRQATAQGKIAILRAGNWKDIARDHRETAIETKRQRLLRRTAERAGHHLQLVEISEIDALMCDIAPLEVRTFFGSLATMGLVEWEVLNDPLLYPDRVRITLNGWTLVERLTSGASTPQPEETNIASTIQADPSRESNQEHDHLRGKESVSMEHAAAYLHVSPRWVRELVKKGKLDVVGEGQHKKITTESLRKYKGN